MRTLSGTLSKHFVGIWLENGPPDKGYDKVGDKVGVAHRFWDRP